MANPSDVPGPASDPGSRLAALADQPAPATTIDIYRAGRDGYRLRLRRRRTGVALSGTAAAGVLGVAAAVLPLSPSPGKTTPGTSSWTSASASASASASGSRQSPTVTVRVPARFGWLPPQISFIEEGPSGGSDYTAAAGTTAGKSFSELRIFLKVRDTAPPAPASEIPVAGLGTTAYWSAGKGQTAVAGQSDLVWRDASGRWLTLSSSHLDADTASAAAALEHVARTVAVGEVPLPLPVQIRGLPSSTVLSVDQALLTQAVLPARGATTGLQLALRVHSSSVQVLVEPAGTVQGPWNGRTSACDDSDGWNICVVADAGGAAALPGGVAGLLAHLEGLGTDPGGWSTDLLAE